MQDVSARVRIAQVQTSSEKNYCEIKYYLNGRLQTLTKIQAEEFSPAHWRTLQNISFDETGHLLFDNPEWQSLWLGAGEEKTVYLIVDEKAHAFALELLDRRTYLEGQLVEGQYFGDVFMSKINGYKPNPESLVGHVFGSRGRVREFIYGETLAGKLTQPRHKEARRLPLPMLLLTWISYHLARMMVFGRYAYIQEQYSDAHEANVAIELIPLHNPEQKKHYFLPLLWSDQAGHLHWYYFRLTPIDVRTKARRHQLI